jgi:hypothetical protein
MQTTSFAWRCEKFALLSAPKHRHPNYAQSIANGIARCGREATLVQTQARLADLEEPIFGHASLNSFSPTRRAG